MKAVTDFDGPVRYHDRPVVLFLCHRIPYPPDKGDKIRSWQIFRHLCSRARVYLGCFIDDPDDWQHVPRLRAMAADVRVCGLSPRWAKLLALRGLVTGEPLTMPYFWDRHLADWVSRICRDDPPSLVFGFSSPMGAYFERVPPEVPRVMDFVDVDSAKWTAYAAQRKGLARWVYAREGRLLAQTEQYLAETAQASIVITEPERALLGPAAARATVIGNGTDLTLFDPTRPSNPPFPEGDIPVVFTGAMDYPPNEEAAVWFAHEVLPRLRAARNDVSFWIVGARPTDAVQALAKQPGVVVTGRVAEVTPYLAHAALAVAPLHTARGVQNKVLEAMAMAQTVVATPAAFEGIQAEPERELCLAEDADGFTQTILDLLAAPARRTAIGEAARRRIERDYAWTARMSELDSLLAAVVPDWPAAVSRVPASV